MFFLIPSIILFLIIFSLYGTIKTFIEKEHENNELEKLLKHNVTNTDDIKNRMNTNKDIQALIAGFLVAYEYLFVMTIVYCITFKWVPRIKNKCKKIINEYSKIYFRFMDLFKIISDNNSYDDRLVKVINEKIGDAALVFSDSYFLPIIDAFINKFIDGLENDHYKYLNYAYGIWIHRNDRVHENSINYLEKYKEKFLAKNCYLISKLIIAIVDNDYNAFLDTYNKYLKVCDSICEINKFFDCMIYDPFDMIVKMNNIDLFRRILMNNNKIVNKSVYKTIIDTNNRLPFLKLLYLFDKERMLKMKIYNLSLIQYAISVDNHEYINFLRGLNSEEELNELKIIVIR